MTLETISLEYAVPNPAAKLRERSAQRLCAPCCEVISYRPFRYCDSVTLEGETYCGRHTKSHDEQVAKPKFRFSLRAPELWQFAVTHLELKTAPGVGRRLNFRR